MHPLIQLKKAAPVFLVALVCFGFLPTMEAVTPAPDGFYPGMNTAEGKDALFSLTTGVSNTAVGFDALYYNNTGSQNTATGFASLFKNTAKADNTAAGVSALSLITCRSYARAQNPGLPLPVPLAVLSSLRVPRPAQPSYRRRQLRIQPPKVQRCQTERMPRSFAIPGNGLLCA